MSINAQALADLEDQGILNDDLPFSEAAVSGRSASVLTNPSSVGSQTPMSDDLKKRLLSPATVYKTITHGVETVTDMENVQKSIATSNAISFSGAEEVAMTFENFHTQVSLKEFTKVPSQINLAFTQRYMASRILLRKENVATSFENFLAGPVVDSEEAFQTYKDFYAKALFEELRAFQPLCQAWLENKKSVPAQIFQTGKEFLNFATVPMKDLPTNTKGVGAYQLFHDALKNLTALSTDGFHTNNLLDVIRLKGSFSEFIDPQRSAQASAIPRSALDFLQCFGNPYLVEFLQNVEKDAEQAVKSLIALKNDAQLSPTEFQQVRDFVVRNGREIDKFNEKLHYYLELMEVLRVMYPNVSVVLDYFTV